MPSRWTDRRWPTGRADTLRAPAASQIATRRVLQEPRHREIVRVIPVRHADRRHPPGVLELRIELTLLVASGNDVRVTRAIIDAREFRRRALNARPTRRPSSARIAQTIGCGPMRASMPPPP